MSDKHKFDSEISTDNNISIPEYLREKYPPASKVNVALTKQEQQKVPTSLYRHQSMQTDIHRLMDLFVHNKLWFSSPSSFNDPFDCKAHIDFHDSTINDLIQIYEKTKWFNSENVKEEELKLSAKYFFHEGVIITTENKEQKQKDFYERYAISLEKFFESHENQNEIYERGKNNIQDYISRLLDMAWGIISLTEDNSDMLMWSHYGGSHKGFCLQFSTEHMLKMKEKQQQNKKRVMKINKITYDSSYYTVKEFLELDQDINEFHQKILLRKSPNWDYEKEWRMIYLNAEWDNNIDWVQHNDRYIYFLPEMLTGVIFGYKMDNKDKDAIRHLLKDRKEPIQFYQAKKKPNEFGLKIDEIK